MAYHLLDAFNIDRNRRQGRATIGSGLQSIQVGSRAASWMSRKLSHLHKSRRWCVSIIWITCVVACPISKVTLPSAMFNEERIIAIVAPKAPSLVLSNFDTITITTRIKTFYTVYEFARF